jgi:hypothetical protein
VSAYRDFDINEGEAGIENLSLVSPNDSLSPPSGFLSPSGSISSPRSPRGSLSSLRGSLRPPVFHFTGTLGIVRHLGRWQSLSMLAIVGHVGNRWARWQCSGTLAVSNRRVN